MFFADNENDKVMADGMKEIIKSKCPSAEIYTCLGGQNIYNYVIAFS